MHDSIQLQFPYTFVDRVLAEFVLIPESRLKICAHSAMPCIAVALFVYALQQGIPFDLSLLLLLLVVLPLFTPAIIVYQVAISYLTNKKIREPFTYTFNNEGVCISSPSYEYVQKWVSITHVKVSRLYLLFFIAPGSAHCIPMSAIRENGLLPDLLKMSQENGVKVQQGRQHL